MIQNSHPHFINGAWVASSGQSFISFNPSTGLPLWEGAGAGESTVEEAVQSARDAFPGWARLSLESRYACLERFAALLKEKGADLVDAISQEVGKPLWESRTEVTAMANKVAISRDAHEQRNRDFFKGGASTRFRPHGVVAVLGPFNFPGHLPNGHIVPALLAGNTVVFKPSEQSPYVAEVTIRLWQEAGLPDGVLNLIQGGRDTAIHLASHIGIDGLFFTGSSKAGLALSKAFAEQPGKILALEMGGNNPLVVHEPGDVTAAAYLAVQSAFATAGQRCTCARRLIVTDFPQRDSFFDVLTQITKELVVGAPDRSPEPYMGPVISAQAAQRCIAFQKDLQARGGRSLLEAQHLKEDTGFVSPGLIDVTEVDAIADDELFGPLLQIRCVSTMDDAILEANRTRYGLAAGILCADEQVYQRFLTEARAGIINWNKPLTGASSAAPFGGVGLSGNHRPSAYFAADYCAHPVASLESASLSLPENPLPGLHWS